MNDPSCRVGFAFCGSFCTFHKAMDALEAVKARFGDVTPIVSENSAALDTRFGAAHDWLREMERICDKRVIDSLVKAEPLGPKKLLDALVICPCTGNTLGKLASGIADSTVTLAAKAHLRNGRPLIIAVSTNDALASSANAEPKAARALEQLAALKGCQAHCSVILSPADATTYKRLGLQLTCEPRYQTNKLYHR